MSTQMPMQQSRGAMLYATIVQSDTLAEWVACNDPEEADLAAVQAALSTQPWVFFAAALTCAQASRVLTRDDALSVDDAVRLVQELIDLARCVLLAECVSLVDDQFAVLFLLKHARLLTPEQAQACELGVLAVGRLRRRADPSPCIGERLEAVFDGTWRPVLQCLRCKQQATAAQSPPADLQENAGTLPAGRRVVGGRVHLLV